METNGKYNHFHWLPVNPTSHRLSWSRPDDPRPALLPFQADSSVSNIPLVSACSCGTDRKQTADRLAKLSSQAPQIQRPKHFSTLGWKKENNGLAPLWRLERAQQTAIFRLRIGHCGLSAHPKRIGISDTFLCECGQADQTLHDALPSCRETSANMAAWCWSGDQAVGLGRRPLPDGWFCGINLTEDLTCTTVDRWRRRRRSLLSCWSWRPVCLKERAVGRRSGGNTGVQTGQLW